MRGRRRRDDDWSDGPPEGRAARGGGDGRGGGEGRGGDWQAGQPGRASGGYDEQGYRPGAAYGGQGYEGQGYEGQGYEGPGYEGPGYEGPQGYGGGYGAGEYARDGGYGGHPGYGGTGYVGSGYDGADNGQYGRFPGPGDGDPDAGEFPAPIPSAPVQTGTPRPYGRLSIFTLIDDKAAEFDRLAEEAAEGVRTSEPDTLVYVIHVVPKAPMQRIIYEIYRNRAAFEDHERQPHTQRFAAERRSCVLATNIIDLRLKYAKVAALFQGDQPGRQAQPAQAGWQAQPAPPPAAQRPRRELLAPATSADGYAAAESSVGADAYRTGYDAGGYPQAAARNGWFGEDGGGRYGDGPGGNPAGGPPWHESPDWEPSSHPRRR